MPLQAPSRATPRALLPLTVLGWIALFASYPLALVLPPSTGFENGPIENAQAVLLAAGGVIAAVMAWRTRGTPQTHF